MNSTRPFSSIMVIGAGAWGTSLASLAARNGVATTLWAREEEVVAQINQRHENTQFLPDIALPDTITATSDLALARHVEAIMLVVPVQFSGAVLAQLAPHLDSMAIPVALCSKGIERESGGLMVDVLKRHLPQAIPAVLSGPSFAADVAKGLPTAVTLACQDDDIGQAWQQSVKAANFRPYLSRDMIGAELGGAVKNVLAIACGISDGKGYGESAKAALIARGFAEFQRLGAAMGADPQSMAGLSGLGDLILTCSSRQSRNMSLGYEIGKGGSAQEILAARKTVSEGAATARPLRQLAAAKNIEMPICQAVADIIEGRIKANEAISALLSRPLRQE
ncbi:MAG: NAD(P)H-dependent glycerol-3-phosphate dehydrogenase [bacterium]